MCCGGELCSALLKVRDCTVEGEGGTQRGRLATETMVVLLACSLTAKKVALDSKFTLFCSYFFLVP